MAGGEEGVREDPGGGGTKSWGGGEGGERSGVGGRGYGDSFGIYLKRRTLPLYPGFYTSCLFMAGLPRALHWLMNRHVKALNSVMLFGRQAYACCHIYDNIL